MGVPNRVVEKEINFAFTLSNYNMGNQEFPEMLLAAHGNSGR